MGAADLLDRQADLQRLGDLLYEAWLARETIAPLTDARPDLTIDEAYAIAQRFVARRLQKGEAVVGKKIGVTSLAVQQMLNVHQPDFGILLSGMTYTSGSSIPMRTLISPRAEGEIAFSNTIWLAPASPLNGSVAQICFE